MIMCCTIQVQYLTIIIITVTITVTTDTIRITFSIMNEKYIIRSIRMLSICSSSKVLFILSYFYAVHIRNEMKEN